MGEQAAEVHRRKLSQLVVERTAKTVAGPVIPVIPVVYAVGTRECLPVCEGVEPLRRFNVVNAALVPVETAAEEYAQTLLFAKALAGGGAELVKPAAGLQRRISAHGEYADVGIVMRAFCHQVYRSADGVCLLVGRERLADFHGINQVGGNNVELHIAYAFR